MQLDYGGVVLPFSLLSSIHCADQRCVAVQCARHCVSDSSVTVHSAGLVEQTWYAVSCVCV